MEYILNYFSNSTNFLFLHLFFYLFIFFFIVAILYDLYIYGGYPYVNRMLNYEVYYYPFDHGTV